MADVAELLRRVEALEKDASLEALVRLERRLGEVERRIEGHNTVLGKALVILEETRLRVSDIEVKHGERLDRLESSLGQLRKEFNDFRRSFPGEVAEAMREVLKEQR